MGSRISLHFVKESAFHIITLSRQEGNRATDLHDLPFYLTLFYPPQTLSFGMVHQYLLLGKFSFLKNCIHSGNGLQTHSNLCVNNIGIIQANQLDSND